MKVLMAFFSRIGPRESDLLKIFIKHGDKITMAK